MLALLVPGVGMHGGGTVLAPPGGTYAEAARLLAFSELGRAIEFTDGARAIELDEPPRPIDFDEPARAVTWSIAMRTLIKRPAEERTYTFDFADEPEIVAGDTIADSPAPTVTITLLTDPARNGGDEPEAASITVAGDGQSFSAVISGGAEGNLYHVEGVCTTDAGSVLAREGRLWVSARADTTY